MQKKTGWRILGIIFFCISLIFIFFGFNTSAGDTLFDAIINSSRANGCFIMSVFCLFLSVGCGIFYFLTNWHIDNTNFFENKESCVTLNEKWNCSNCGALNNSENKFCNKCGQHKNEDKK